MRARSYGMAAPVLAIIAGCPPALAEGQAPRAWPAAFSPSVVAVLDSCPLTGVQARTESAIATAAAGSGATLLSATAGAVVDRGLDLVGSLLETYADSFGASSTGYGTGRLLDVTADRTEPQAGCLIFVRGPVTTTAVRPGGDEAPLATMPQAWQKAVQDLNQKLREEAARERRPMAFRLTATPEVYAEFQFAYRSFVGAADGQPPFLAQFALSPVLVYFGRSGAQRGQADEKTLLFQITLSSLAPGAAVPTTLLTQVFDMGRLAASGATCMAAVTPRAVRDMVACRREILHEPQYQPLRAGGRVTAQRAAAPDGASAVVVRDPVYLRAELTLTEVQQAGDFARAIGETLRRDQVAREMSSHLDGLIRGLLSPGNQPAR